MQHTVEFRFQLAQDDVLVSGIRDWSGRVLGVWCGNVCKYICFHELHKVRRRHVLRCQWQLDVQAL